MTGLTVRLLAAGLLILLTASCSSASESVSTTSVIEPSPVTEATREPGPELSRIISSLEEYGRQGGAPYAAGDGWVIVTETQTLAEQIADALGGTAG
jgi:hypothetical protein